MSERALGLMDAAPGKGLPLFALSRAAIGFLRPGQRRRVRLAALASAAIAVLDLAGVLLVGALVAIVASRAGQSAPVPIPGIDEISDAWLVTLSIVGLLLLLVRSVCAWRLNRRVLRYVARRETEMAIDFLHRVQSAPFEEMSGLTTQEIVEGVRWGSRGIAGIVSHSVFAIGEAALLALLVALLAVVDPFLCLVLGTMLGLLVHTVSRVTARRLREAGEGAGAGSVVVGEVIAEAVGLSRESRLYGFADVGRDRLAAGQTMATDGDAALQVWFQFPRYVVEIALVFSMGIIVLALWVRGATPEALTSTAVFIAASSRVLPSLLRLQNYVGAIRGFEGQLVPVRRILGLSGHPSPAPPVTKTNPRGGAGPPAIELRDVTYRYPSATTDALRDVTLSIPAGCRTAVVGSSGAGKSTLADIVLGLLQPSAGEVRWDGDPACGVPVGFVPQDVFLTSGSIAANVALGVAVDDIDLDAVWEAVTRARLTDVVEAQPKGIWTTVGERGVRLSGGQRQRLGVARALYRQPALLVLDEATSSLDASTEHDLTTALNEVRGAMTTVVIAHRLATVRDADLVVVLEQGTIRARGSFDEVLAADPTLARAASLQGLHPLDQEPSARGGHGARRPS